MAKESEYEDINSNRSDERDDLNNVNNNINNNNNNNGNSSDTTSTSTTTTRVESILLHSRINDNNLLKDTHSLLINDDDENDDEIELKEYKINKNKGGGDDHSPINHHDEDEDDQHESLVRGKSKDEPIIMVADQETGSVDLNASNETPVITKQQWIRIMVIYTAVLSDGLSLTLVQPFLPALLQEKWHFSESQVGYVSGLLIGSYSLARFFSSFYIGHMSDKFGRKPFLILSLVSTGLGTTIFSFMPNVYLAIGVRFIEGIFSNTTALCQATLADMVDKRNRPAIFAYLGAIFALSRCLSSTLGGIVVKLAEGTENPYVYPCVVGGGIVLCSAALVSIVHPETHPKFSKEGISAVQLDKTKTQDYTLIEGLKMLAQDKALMMLYVIGSVNSFSNGGLLLALVLFSSLSIEERGLGMDSFENGIMFSVLGLFGFVFQITFFKRLSKKFGLKKQYLMGSMLLSIGMALYPLTFMGYLMNGKAMVWVLMMIIVPINSIGFMQCLPIVGGMIANASKPELQGLTQGTSQSLNSLLRSFGPAISGAIFSLSLTYSIPWLLFVLLSCIYVTLSIISLYLPDSVDVLRSGKNDNKH